MHCDVHTLPNYFEPWIIGYSHLDERVVPVVRLCDANPLRATDSPTAQTTTTALLVETDPAFMISCDSVSRPVRLLGTNAQAASIPENSAIPGFLLFGAVTGDGTVAALNIDRTSRLLAGVAA